MGTVFLRGNSWVCEYRVNGKVHRKTLVRKEIITKTQAREMLKEIERKIALGEFDLLPKQIPTLSGVCKELHCVCQRDTVQRRSWKRMTDMDLSSCLIWKPYTVIKDFPR
ncbi:MAG: hypothetical protein KatS3mg078_1318 [Deltaproteobacteria bacterium]|nr:MAG: hypothetical protein KatS3mg078_1318 [Deltaproteobacteria bacterium]